MVVGFIALLIALGGISGLSWARYLNVILGVWLILRPCRPPVEAGTILISSWSVWAWWCRLMPRLDRKLPNARHILGLALSQSPHWRCGRGFRRADATNDQIAANASSLTTKSVL